MGAKPRNRPPRCERCGMAPCGLERVERALAAHGLTLSVSLEPKRADVASARPVRVRYAWPGEVGVSELFEVEKPADIERIRAAAQKRGARGGGRFSVQSVYAQDSDDAAKERLYCKVTRVSAPE